ncbi:arylsulfatase [Bradyrhizobium sp. Leo121]|uniref:arylsulfatase n=1 Tax=Bradyrhizobium sp. Leo121 TaxID=1571195 RepID=UPI00102A313A|nr:arylsulfatase [Bradyrhizobium sp. Leo121]RZN30177.1 arylsulfatase [Bradyrhizobium sp. Leo121]
MRNRVTLSALAAVGLGIATATAQSQPPVSPDVKTKTPEPAGLGGYPVLPPPEAPFLGTIGRTAKDSTPDFPKEVKAPKGAPNILLILTDDVGFGASSPFGGPIPTPTLDRLAKNGLRYNQFHTTAVCSPTRTALLTGRNQHSCSVGIVMELATGYPGYNSLMPKSCGTFAEVLKQNGWNTAWYGKNHNVPDWHSSQAGPFDLWPTGLGFEYFYGFFGGDTNQYSPALYENIKPIEPPHDQKDYFFEKDLADHFIDRLRTLRAVAPEKPWVAYYAPGTAHAPLHAPKDWIAKFKGKFDEGWDKQREITLENQKRLGIVPADTQLTPRPAAIPAWDSFDADHQKVFAHMMEVYAAALSYCDYQIGRVLDAIEQSGDLDNTLVIYIQGDNGASAEGTPQGLLNELTILNGIPEDFKEVQRRMDELGGPMTNNHYPVGWAHAMDTPFQWTKQIASHFGGTRNDLVISWPARIKGKGGIRSQFSSVIDIAPTILEATGIQFPSSINGVAQKPVEGGSLLYTFDDAKAASRHKTQYFEVLGFRGIYHEGWMASTTPPIAPWNMTSKLPPVDEYKWELYHVTYDFSQAKDLAAENPAKLLELKELFWAEAGRYNVMPLDNSRIERFDVSIRPSLLSGRHVFTYYPGIIRIPEGSAPDLKNKSFEIRAEVETPEAGADGVLLTQGGRFGGYGLYLLNGKLVYHYNLAGIARYNVVSKEKVPAGKHTLTANFKYDGGLGKGGAIVLSVDGKAVAEGRVERTLPMRVSLDETFDVGEDAGTPVSEDYQVPFKFTGTLNKVVVTLGESKLSAEDQKAYEEAQTEFALQE